jgi:hypothetical protein
MFIRRARTRNKATGEAYFTHRLVASVRTGKQVRQVSLLNLGRHFDLPQLDWPRLCTRIEAVLAAQPGLLGETKPIETLAQRYAARLTADRPAAREATLRTDPPRPNAATPSPPPTSPRSRSPLSNSPAPARSASRPLALPPSAGSGSPPSCKASASTGSSAPPWPPA